MLKATAELEEAPFEEEWPFAIHLLSHIYANDINSARFLWKSIPSTVKEMQPGVVSTNSIACCCFLRDLHREDVLSAYSTVGIQDTALFLGMNEDDAASYVMQQGWVVDPASRMLIVKKQPVATEQKLDPSKLQRLTEYVFHLEH
ncbi:PREDICTED: COP9 signalosome complex subunit 8-like [Populus euphratica]|uniref:COP9 signalosome complex subunit 8-like n=1 Tax=Populus euphratica TaxID=75702 RepID=A0AAJ6X7X9_POPEU|nr:PREDICTED: COP9 signalosome complex subunit 8-like [Populus euphratica]